MNLILNIDTAVQNASICIACEEEIMDMQTNPDQKEHAGWLQVSIKKLFEEHQLTLHQLSAIAVSSGPGSYTGLRVSMATAKGLCYALQLPLITVNTLHMMAVAALNEPTDLVCPMIDARRMEVFTAVLDKNLNEVVQTCNLIIEDTSFVELLEYNTITFFGNGSDKFQNVCNHPNARFKPIEATAKELSVLSFRYFKEKRFADLAYSEPFYGKEFYSPPSKTLI